MANRGHKIIKTLLITLAVIVVGGLLVNWYMTYRLQSKLNKELSRVIYNATDGFYRFSFDKLSVGLFSGELTMEGVKLIPDSTTFLKWQTGDSLPDLYYDIHIGKIYFKGINLTWHKDYRELNFSLFEVSSPNVKIFEPVLSKDTLRKATSSHELDTLYNIIAPYVNLLTVNRIKLKNANVSYKLLDPQSPIIYALQGAELQTYNFRLDKNSFESGKLLYSDNFEFSATKPQVLLYSDQIILKTNNIQLSTIDSVIKIEGVDIYPKNELWEQRKTRQGGYLRANVKSVQVKGIDFTHKDGLNYLSARAFDISSTNIDYHSVKADTVTPVSKKDSISKPWSLYGILSPILQSISIDKIGIEKTKFSYSLTQNGYTDIYSLEQFDFHANKFLVDSLSEKKKKFWYVDNFAITSTNINGLQNSNNLDVNIDDFYLSTIDHNFSLSGITIRPLSTNTKKDYLLGDIKRIRVEGLDYNSGVSAEQIEIDSANVQYFKVASKQKAEPTGAGIASTESFLDVFTPYSEFLSVKGIKLKDANITYHNQGDTYDIRNLNFYASDFLINKQTRNSSPYLFTYNDIGISFRDFDNLVFNKSYRLQIKKADVSTLTGRVTLAGLKFIPQKEEWSNIPNTYVGFSSPFINISGFNKEFFVKNKAVKLRSLAVESPKIEITKVRDAKQTKEGVVYNKDVLSQIGRVIVDDINFSNIDLGYTDLERKSNLLGRLDTLTLKTVDWSISQKFHIGELTLRSPIVKYEDKSSNDKKQSDKFNPSLFGNNVAVGKFVVSNASVNVKQPDGSMYLKFKDVDFSGLEWKVQNEKSSLSLAAINLNEPYLDVNVNKVNANGGSVEKTSDVSKNVYEFVGSYVNKADIKSFNLVNANVNYTHGAKKANQAVNKTNLYVNGLTFIADQQKLDVADIRFSTKDLYFPVMDGFYTLGIGSVYIDKKRETAEISNITLKSLYPKLEFAYKQPQHKDWFDVTVGDISFSGLDYPVYFSDNKLKARNLDVENVVLRNFKNQQIEIEHNVMPLIYEKLHTLPVKLDIDTANVSNFSVLYEELPKKGSIPGKIYFENMNGRLLALTNIASSHNQFIRSDVDGKFMGGYFTARWDIPVSPDYDCFVLEANMGNYDLKNLNDIFLPLARAELTSGMLQKFHFRTEASSLGATANMRLLYNDLKIQVLKDGEGEQPNKFLSQLANMVIRTNNPNNERSKPREANIVIERDPYHSTFNYFWQILQPAVTESVGVSQKKQNFAKKAASFLSKIKNFFSGKKKTEEAEDSPK